MSARAQVFRAACVQLNSQDSLEANIAAATELIREAASAGAKLVLTPENTTMITRGREAILAAARPEESHPAVPAFSALAQGLGLWLLIGSLTIKAGTIKAGEERCFNRSYLFAPTGAIAARYDKIHLFDVEVPDGQVYRESATIAPGGAAVVADLPWGRLGMSVCYDLRFPYLYRALAKAGAHFLSIPSAFTHYTGEAHWHVLSRARAIETGCFVFAPAQCGTHAGGRRTYGHTLIVAPWGEVLAEGGEEPEVLLAEIDPARVEEARHRLPSLTHDRSFTGPEGATDLKMAGE